MVNFNGQAFLAGLQSDLDDTLDGLGVSAQPARELAAQATACAGELLAAGLAGQDTTVGQGALKALAMNLASATSTTVANSVLALAQKAVLRASVGLVGILV